MDLVLGGGARETRGRGGREARQRGYEDRKEVNGFQLREFRRRPGIDFVAWPIRNRKYGGFGGGGNGYLGNLRREYRKPELRIP